MNTKHEQFQQAISCSEAMLEDAAAGNWEKVFAIEQQRSELLTALFSTTSGDNDIVGMDDKIRKIIDINSQLEAITISARDNVRDDLQAITKGRKAVSSYTTNSV